YMLDVSIVENHNAEEERQQFLSQKKQEEDVLSKQAYHQLQQRESMKSEQGDSDKVLALGTPIKANEPIVPIHEIQDEERRLIIEGFIFDAEVRELRSGRSLLTLKVTDYTDSILVKMFSRDNEDAEIMKSFKKGMWVRARGGIQNDTFVRD